MSDPRQPWEPDPRQVGTNWTGMFEDKSRGGTARRPEPAAPEAFDDATLVEPDFAEYRPWTLQRGQSRPTMMLEFRRFDPKAGFWLGWQTAYSQLIEIEYTGDRILSLDFTTRHVVVEGVGLDELARYLQQGSVIAIQEYSAIRWPAHTSGPCVSAIRRVGADDIQQKAT